jgi:16S rRNA G1207 methylase RsmC
MLVVGMSAAAVAAAVASAIATAVLLQGGIIPGVANVFSVKKIDDGTTGQ